MEGVKGMQGMLELLGMLEFAGVGRGELRVLRALETPISAVPHPSLPTESSSHREKLCLQSLIFVN